MGSEVSAEGFRLALETAIREENEKLLEKNPQSPIFRILEGDEFKHRKVNEPREGVLIFGTGESRIANCMSLFSMRNLYEETLEAGAQGHTSFQIYGFLKEFLHELEQSAGTVEAAQIQLDTITDLQKALNHLRACVCNTNLNQEFLSGIPHRALHDLSVYYRIDVDLPEEMEDSTGMVTVTNQILEDWNQNNIAPITEEALYEHACQNEKNDLRITDIMSVADIFAMDADGSKAYQMPKVQKGHMYIATNRKQDSGAAGALLGIGLDEFLAGKKMNLMILPSSVHEVILLPDGAGHSLSKLAGFVADVNTTALPKEDYLSGCVYCYNYQTKTVDLAYDPAAAVKKRNASQTPRRRGR